MQFSHFIRCDFLPVPAVPGLFIKQIKFGKAFAVQIEIS
jgi:hypothetical protein